MAAAAMLILGGGGYVGRGGPSVYRLMTNQGQPVIEVNNPKAEAPHTEQGA